MVKKLNPHPELIKATMADYPTIQNMARFYVYDMSRYCGFISNEWAFPKDGLYESHDFKKYFEEPDRKAFIVKIDDELAGFVLLNKVGTLHDTDWHECMNHDLHFGHPFHHLAISFISGDENIHFHVSAKNLFS